MSRPPRYVLKVLKQLAEWRQGCRQLALAYRGREEFDEAATGTRIPIWRVRSLVTGKDQIVSVLGAYDIRRRVLRLSREALRRQRAKDWAWFWWLDEYAVTSRIEMHDDFDEMYRPRLDKAGDIERKRRTATSKAAAARRAIGESTRKKVQQGQRVTSKRHARRITRGK